MKIIWMIVGGVALGAANLWAQAGVHVTSSFRIVNGAGQVPAGLFGVHATPLTPEIVADWGIESSRIIEKRPSGIPIVPGRSPLAPSGLKQIVECFYDRYQPALLLTDSNWKTHLENLARTYASNARTTGFQQTVEFWNEPYLNWATNPGVNYDGAYYEPAPEGAPMTIKGWSEPLDSLVWSREIVAVDATSGRVNYLASSYAQPLIARGQLKEGDPYIFRQTIKCRMESRPWGKDAANRTWVSGPQNSQFYRRMFEPFAKALKETDPDVKLVAGWDFNICQDDWISWPVLLKPLIDESISWLDGIDEHHYGGDSRMVAGVYEVECAYAETALGKRLQCYNTEAGGQLDPERPDAGGAPKWTGTSPAEQTGAASYFLRDVTHLIDDCPDKAAARAAHQADANRGNEIAFKMLKELRGSLVRVESSMPRIWGVASVSRSSLCVVVFNDNRANATIPVRIEAPAGTKFLAGTRTVIDLNPEPVLATEAVPAAGKSFAEQAEIGPKLAAKWIFQLSSAPDPARGPALVETQYYAGGVINRLSAGKPVALTVRISPEALKAMTGAEIKIVQENWNPQCTCLLNGQPVTMDVADTWTHIQPINPALLKESNQLVFETNSEKPTNIDMASLVTIAPR